MNKSVNRISSKILLLLLLTPMLLQSKIDVYPFEDKALEKRFLHLITVLRCPKCQNNNLAGSNAGIAKDLKDLVYEKVKNGETDQQIVDYLVDRYGDFVSYDPPINSHTAVIWFGPFFLLLAGFVGIVMYTRKRRTHIKTSVNNDISEEKKLLLTKWAEDKSGSSSDRGINQ